MVGVAQVLWAKTQSFISIKPKSTWVLLKPSVERLVSSFVFPQLSFNETKKALWESDPVDYVRIAVGMYILTFNQAMSWSWVKMSMKASQRPSQPRQPSSSRLQATGLNLLSCLFLASSTLSSGRTLRVLFILSISWHHSQKFGSPTKVRRSQHDGGTGSLDDASSRR